MHNADELWQLYDEQGQILEGRGGNKDDVFSRGILHGASHVWIWRNNNSKPEILLQKRAANKPTWPNCYDISAAGHIDLGEAPTGAALRETMEEIGLSIFSNELKLFGVHRAYLKAGNGAIENEFQWLYSLELIGDSGFTLETSEVESLIWVSLDQFKIECKGELYVPHGKLYYDTVVSAIEFAVS